MIGDQTIWQAFADSMGMGDQPSTMAMRVSFLTDFIPRCRRTAPKSAFDEGRVINVELWERHCQRVGLDDLLRNFPA